ncbi:MAG: hypothetical protein IPQ03_13275 [Bacteroidetes bacterium]|nr:hypothetical protein [Bacteroidota bacterium]
MPLIAIARPGYKFIKWLPTNDTSASITINLQSDSGFIALFDVDTSYFPVLPPVINEVMASNLSAIADNYNEFDDWLEIYNPNPDTLDLQVIILLTTWFYLLAFQLQSEMTLRRFLPTGNILIWADDDTEQEFLHANFKFSSTGDDVYLFAPDAETLIDSVSIRPQATDESYGRLS